MKKNLKNKIKLHISPKIPRPTTNIVDIKLYIYIYTHTCLYILYIYVYIYTTYKTKLRFYLVNNKVYCCCSVANSCVILCTAKTLCTAARQAFLSFTISQSLLKLMLIKSVMPSNYLIFCHPLLLLPSIFPSIRVFPMSWLFAYIQLTNKHKPT